jgi:hypothetical protein
MARARWRSLALSRPASPPSRRCSSWSRLTPGYHESTNSKAYAAPARAADSFQTSTRLDTSEIHLRSVWILSGTVRPGHKASKTETTAWRRSPLSPTTGWSRPLTDAINSPEESLASGSLLGMIFCSALYSSSVAAAAPSESGKASARAIRE